MSAAASAPLASSSSPSLLSHAAAFSSLQSSSCHFGSDLWDAASSVAEQSEDTKAWLAKMTKFVKEKAELDKEYAKNLKKLVLKLAIPDVPRVQDIPIPPSAAAAAAVAIATPPTGSSLATSLNANEALAATTSADGAASAPTPAQPPPPIVDPRSFDRFMMAFRNLHMTLATNFEILSAKIVEQVYRPLNTHRDAHGTNSKRLLGEMEKYTISYQKYLDNLLASRAACQKACQESESMRRKLDAAVGQGGGGSAPTAGGINAGGNFGNELVGAFKADAQTLAKRALKADAAYIQAVKQMRGFRMQTDSTLSHILDQFEQLEMSRLTSSKEILLHYLTVQSQMFGSNLKNLTAVQHVMDKVNPHVDLQYFIMVKKSGKLPIPLPEYQVFKGHPNARKVIEEQERINHGDISAFSSNQAEDGEEASTTPPSAFSSSSSLSSSASGSSSLGASIAPPVLKSKTSGWGWLNTLAQVVTTGSAKAHRTTIDHDAESVLARGGNYYDRSTSGDSAATDGDMDGHTFSPIGGGQGGGGVYQTHQASGGLRDETDEEKTPERKAAEQTLADMFDAITGRVAIASPTAASVSSPSPPTSIVTYHADRERDLTASELETARALLATPDGRKSFSSVLNRQRNTSGGLKVSASALHRLAELTRIFLDEATAAMHVSPAQLVMIMSQSFYTESDLPSSVDDSSGSSSPSSDVARPSLDRRTYLISLIKGHPLWRDMRMWEEAFFDALNSKIRKSPAAKVHKWYSDAEQADSLHMRKQVCFSTLSTFVHNMGDFDMEPKSIIEFTEKIQKMNELEPEQVDMLRSMAVYQEVDIHTLDPAIASELAANPAFQLNHQQATSASQRADEAEESAPADSRDDFESIPAEGEEADDPNLP